MNGTWTDVFPGTCIYSPRGTVHAFKNNTDQPIRVFINIAPAGFERFFAEVAEEWAQPERDMSPITATRRSACGRGVPTKISIARQLGIREASVYRLAAAKE